MVMPGRMELPVVACLYARLLAILLAILRKPYSLDLSGTALICSQKGITSNAKSDTTHSRIWHPCLCSEACMCAAVPCPQISVHLTHLHVHVVAGEASIGQETLNLGRLGCLPACLGVLGSAGQM